MPGERKELYDLLQHAEGIIAGFPDGDMLEASRQLLRESPVDWVVARNRQLRAAILRDDVNLVIALHKDVAHVVGEKNALDWLEKNWGAMVADELKQDGWGID